MSENTPAAGGYYFPAEFALHTATWLSWPHNPDTWPGKIETIFSSYAQFVKVLTAGEYVHINVADKNMEEHASRILNHHNVPLDRVRFFHHPTNDAWCRDHGPAFLINPEGRQSKVIVDWGHNAWGGKYPPFDLDDVIPTLIAKAYNIPVYHPGIIMEGGSVDFNGAGTLITSTSCLLNPNRNPHLTKREIEQYLIDYYGVQQILWVDEGIVGDDTDGHIDDTVRFYKEDSVITVIEHNKQDENYALLKRNLKQLKEMRLADDRQLTIVELPMPDPVYYEGQRLPASYANFYISNLHVIVPTFRCKRDVEALDILSECFPERDVVGIDSTDIIWGLGSFHCLSQQEPAV
ncbi:MAG TPA: agmatine deiminase family protein [Saprospiraceae bacterium]